MPSETSDRLAMSCSIFESCQCPKGFCKQMSCCKNHLKSVSYSVSHGKSEKLSWKASSHNILLKKDKYRKTCQSVIFADISSF